MSPKQGQIQEESKFLSIFKSKILTCLASLHDKEVGDTRYWEATKKCSKYIL